MKKPLRQRSSLVYVLVALIPYSKPNLLLTFRPSQFFKELEKVSKYRRETLRDAYRRGVRSGYIKQVDEQPKLTSLGKRRAQPFVATKLAQNSRLMVIFDIPEQQAGLRQQFRGLLRQWQFEQVQKSVWLSEYDYREALIEAIGELNLVGCVEIHESARHFPG